MSSEEKPSVRIDQTISSIEAGGVAIGVQYKGLSPEEVKTLFLKLKREDQPRLWNGRIPYMGLSAFQESDAQFFFGRESLVDELLQRVEAASFVCIAGPSGSGKSSAARAGLLHALRSGRLDKSETWLLADMQPKDDPIDQLAQALERTTQSTTIGDAIRENPTQLARQIALYMSSDPRQRFVLLVDQFEEVFTQTKDSQQRALFINLLTAVAQHTESRATIILAMRTDFISHCANFPQLRSLISNQFQLVGAMAPPNLAKAITLPALEVGADISPELVSRILADMKGEAGALPLMSFTLRDLFEAEKTASGKPLQLTLEAYLARGGVTSALQRHADRVFATFTPKQQALAKNIFSRLVEIGDRTYTSRTASFDEIIPANVSLTETKAVIDALAKAGVRLITVSGGANAADVQINIAHERLIEAWPWLHNLVNENRETIALQNQISHDAKRWFENRDDGYLYRGKRLSLINRHWDALHSNLNRQSRLFIKSSRSHLEMKNKQQKAQRQREEQQAQRLAEEKAQRAAAEQKRSVLFRRAVAGGGVLMIFLLLAIGYGVISSLRTTDLMVDLNMAITEAEQARADAEAAIATAAAAWAAVESAQNESEKELLLNEAAAAAAAAEAAVATAEAIEAEVPVTAVTGNSIVPQSTATNSREKLFTTNNSDSPIPPPPTFTPTRTAPPPTFTPTQTALPPTWTSTPTAPPPTWTPTSTFTATPTQTTAGSGLEDADGPPTEIPTQETTQAPTETPTEPPIQAPTAEPTEVPVEEDNGTEDPPAEPTQPPTATAVDDSGE